jgi:N-carbamoylputrescine amidase
MKMKIMCVEWPASLQPESAAFDLIAKQIAGDMPDMLVTNEMPFGDWAWSVPGFDREVAERNVQLHEAGLNVLRSLDVPIVMSSRPVWVGTHLVNEAFALAEGKYHRLHQKHYFPSQAGWYESSWFHAGVNGFEVSDIGGLKVGVALCTDLMFNERARAYGRAGADLIIVPRATGVDVQSWRIACAMAALVAGSYVISSNRVGPMTGTDILFGGVGMAFAPGGAQILETSREQPMRSFDANPAVSAEKRQQYPCNVTEELQIAGS